MSHKTLSSAFFIYWVLLCWQSPSKDSQTSQNIDMVDSKRVALIYSPNKLKKDAFGVKIWSILQNAIFWERPFVTSLDLKWRQRRMWLRDRGESKEHLGDFCSL